MAQKKSMTSSFNPLTPTSLTGTSRSTRSWSVEAIYELHSYGGMLVEMGETSQEMPMQIPANVRKFTDAAVHYRIDCGVIPTMVRTRLRFVVDTCWNPDMFATSTSQYLTVASMLYGPLLFSRGDPWYIAIRILPQDIYEEYTAQMLLAKAKPMTPVSSFIESVVFSALPKQVEDRIGFRTYGLAHNSTARKVTQRLVKEHVGPWLVKNATNQQQRANRSALLHALDNKTTFTVIQENT